VTPDPVTLNVMASAFHSIAEEMGVNLLLTARSTIIREARDCSCALLDADGRIVSEAEHIPVQMSSLSLPMRACLAKHGTIAPGEVFVTNDPFLGGQHLQDITIFSPIFHEGALLGFSASIAHHVDIGGGSAGLTLGAREFYEEGLRFSALKLKPRARLRERAASSTTSSIRTSVRRARPGATSRRNSPPTKSASGASSSSQGAMAARRSPSTWAPRWTIRSG
jgi:N-methylhydantoinase B/oxoprolinase/acetone carboxylase alpha subunit